MLILSRKISEVIVINDDIRIVVVKIRGDKVCLGVEAPEEVPVRRLEVFDAIRRQEKTLEKVCKRVRAEMDAGKPLHQIQDDLDGEENQERQES